MNLNPNKKTAVVFISLFFSFSLYARTDTAAVNLQHLETQLAALQTQVGQLEKTIKHRKQSVQQKADAKKQNKFSLFPPGGSVVIAPFTNQPTYYSGGQLIVLAPSINEDAKLLYRRLLNERLRQNAGLPSAARPRLVLSGQVDGKVNYTHPYAGRYTSDINLSNAELDTLAEITPWVNGFMAFTYDDKASSNDSGSTAANRRISNSRLYLDKGFITIGNFNESGFYGTMGQFTVPFGRYSSSMITSPLTEAIGKTKARAISLNYIANPETKLVTPYSRIFVFKGDTKYGKNTGIVKNFGVDLGTWLGNEQTHGGVGVSYLHNIADANDMQDNGMSSNFRGFEKTNVTASESIVHRVPGLDFYSKFATGPFSLVGELAMAMQQFSEADMTYDSHGAKPKALNLEAAYAFHVFKLPSSFAVGYGLSREALALNIPAQRYIADWSLTIMNDVTFSLELRRDKNYGKGHTATGKTLQAYTANELGQTDYAATGELSVFF